MGVLPLAASAPSGRLAPKWRVLISVIFGIFMVILDTTVVNVAFQTLRTEYGASLNDAQWIISVYVLVLGISTPLAGFFSERFGMKQTYLTGLGIFVLGSLLCGLAPSLPFLIAARALQGFGGGIATPLGIAILLRTFPISEQGLALGIFGIAVLVAPAIGPMFGGVLVDVGWWRAIFFINPPIGLLGIFLGSRFLPNLKSGYKPALDVWGLITEIIGFGAVLYAASIAATEGWTAPDVLRWFAVGAIGLAAFAVVELFIAKEPLLDLRLFAKRIFLNASVLGYVSVIALFGAEFLMPIYLQSVRGISATETGLILVPLAITGAIATVIAGRLYDKLGPRLIMGFGFGVLVINTWQLSQLKADTSIGWIVFLLALRGVALGSTVQTTLVTALSVVPLKHLAGGSSLINATRQVVQAIGVAVLASTLSPQVAALEQQFLNLPQQVGAPPVGVCNLPTAISSPASDPAMTPSPQLIDRACQETVAGFEQAYKVTFFASIAAVVLGLMLPGWPGKWAGRRAADGPTAIGH